MVVVAEMVTVSCAVRNVDPQFSHGLRGSDKSVIGSPHPLHVHMSAGLAFMSKLYSFEAMMSRNYILERVEAADVVEQCHELRITRTKELAEMRGKR